MSGWPAILISLAAGVAFTAYTVSLRRWKPDRGDHRYARYYHHYERIQGWPHNNATALSPIVAVGAFVFALAILADELGGLDGSHPWVAALLAVALLVLLVLLAMSAWALIRPASWMLPPWLVEARRRQKAGLPSNVPMPPEGDRPVMTRRAFHRGALAYAGFAVAWWLMGLPLPPLLFGLGFAIPMLVATRIKD